MSSMDQHVLTAKLTRFEDVFAVLINETAGEFRWPIKNLPDNVRIGDSVQLAVRTAKAEDDEKYERMRKLLEELIN